MPLSAGGAWSLLFLLPRPQGALEWACRVVLEELAISATLFFSLGLLWGISGRQRVKMLLDAASLKLVWIQIPIAVPVVVAVLSFVLFG